MAAITEDFVSFETAKLLKEKNCPDFGYSCICDSEGNKAQTQSIIMKWLREVHDLIIYVKLVNDGDLNHDAWGFVIYNKFTNEYIKSDKLWFKYEEVCDAAIRYCLKNLI